MTLPVVALGLIGFAIVVYALTGGADFGAGVWHLLATGPRAKDQRKAVAQAIGPVWEANHVWILFALILLFTCFPGAFVAIASELNVPITLVLGGIVLRGSAFVFRSYGMLAATGKLWWNAVFGLTSVSTPLCLGIMVGGMSAGGDWASPFAFAVGVLALVIFAFLAAVYLACVTAGELREDFRRRAIAAGILAGVVAVGVNLLAADAAPRVYGNLTDGALRKLLLFGTQALALGTLAALFLRRVAIARFGAIVQVAAILASWGLAMDGTLVLSETFPIEAAASPPEVLRTALAISAGGAALLTPALVYLMRVFRGGASPG